MDEEIKKRVAVFRLGVIADFVNGRQLQWGDVERLMWEKCAQRWLIPCSLRTRISESAIKDWIRRYKSSGNKLESLYPGDRNDRGKTRAIDPETATGLISLRKEMPSVKLPVLMKEAQKLKLIKPGQKIAYSTLYRILRGEGLLKRIPDHPQDRFRFEAKNPNDLLQSDVMHGPYVTVEGIQRKTYLLCLLDDMSMLIYHGEFYLYERVKCYLDSLRQALLKRGIPRKLYVNNDSSFRSHPLEHICAALGIVLIHSNPYKSERHGNGKLRIMESCRQVILSTHCILRLFYI
jgi:transposase